MKTKTEFTPAPTAESLPRLRTAAVISAFLLIPGMFLAWLAVLSSGRFSACFENGDNCTNPGAATGTQMQWALVFAALAFVLVVATPDRARRVYELRVTGLCFQIAAEFCFLSMIVSQA
ncbi:hypothetical protein [Streptomyces sp. CBMA152]|uniref:hypothetical protein n=1 Tax=Streptomyces sp. CBMA152 TaxID=1896312 RepID=UPI001660C3C5|nr:hypothetical protein [Streptomyces sp. CBMA152]MBD0747423.1 hypothetical protein [Streptomyces sp. CBMA152]